MKKYVLTLFAMLLLAGASCQEKIDIEKEKEAIIAVIEKETNATKSIGFDSWASLIEAWESSYVQDESLVIIGGGKNGYVCMKGWEEIAMDPAVRDSLINAAEPPEPVDYRVEYTNYQIKVYPECAWAYYNEDHISSEGELLRHYDCVRFLKKIDGEWEINFSSYFNATSYEEVEEEASETEEPETEETE